MGFFNMLMDYMLTPIINESKRNRLPKLNGAKPSGKQYDNARTILAEVFSNTSLIPNYDRLLNIVAYFIKYKESSYECNLSPFELSGLKFDNQLNKYIISRESSLNELKITALSRTLATAPWMGDSDTAYEESIHILLKKEIIENYIIQINGEYRIVFELNLKNITLLKNIFEDWEMAEQERSDYEFIEGKTKFEKILNIISAIPDTNKHIALNIATFHARTLMNSVSEDSEKLKNLLIKYPHLVVNILIIGEKSSKLAKENATKEEFKKVFREGISKTYNDFSEYKNRVNIRSIHDHDEMAYLRGTIILAEKEIIFCSQIFWRFGADRGIYAKELITHSDNSFSRNFHFLFEKYFGESYPEHKIIAKGMYYMKIIGVPLLFSTLISLALILFINPKISGIMQDKFLGLDGFISSFIASWIMFFCTNLFYNIKRKIYII